MHITVIGTGFVGIVTSAVFSSLGHRVFGLDVDERKVASLTQGKAPFFEPDLDDLVAKGLQQKNLSFTTSYEEAIKDADVVFIAVGTPSAANGTADLTYVFQAAESMAPFLKDRAIVVVKSTVPPGTNKEVERRISEHTSKRFYVASVPEFLREGTAVRDTLHPDRIILGTEDEWVAKTLLTLHEPFPGERVVVKPESAQMAKYAANAYLAMRITFINQIANLCEKNGASVSEVIASIGLDKRIGTHYWYPGLGYGGSCFPKDVKELAAVAREVGEGNGLLVKIDELNEERIESKMAEFVEKAGSLHGKVVSVLGLSFKPNTNDMRVAPSLKVIPWLQKQGALVRAYDPQAMKEAEKFFEQVTFCADPYEAVTGASAIILLVEWPELIQLNLKELIKQTEQPCWFFDTRNQYRQEDVEAAGFKYINIGNG